jgi:hypothetical protein
VGERAKQ